jgi:predicted DsbA family dithiol-disulfide isomerase
VENACISSTAIDATEYPDLVRRYGVNGVPKMVINDTLEIIGAATEAEVVRTVLSVAGLK